MDFEHEVGRYVRAPPVELDHIPDVGAEVEIESDFVEQQDDEMNVNSGKLERFGRIKNTESRLVAAPLDRGNETVQPPVDCWARGKSIRSGTFVGNNLSHFREACLHRNYGGHGGVTWICLKSARDSAMPTLQRTCAGCFILQWAKRCKR